MEFKQYVARLTVGFSSGNSKGKFDKKLQEQEVAILKSIRDYFEEKGEQGSLQFYMELKGWPFIFHVFGGYAGFLGAMEKAGYDKSFRSKKKKEWQELFIL